MVNLFLTIIRALFALIDTLVVWLIKNLYVLLVQIANTNVFGSFIYQMLGRIYVFLGIFMLFKLTMSMITYIINPDTMTDKSKGFSKLISNVVISLILIVTVPSLFREAYRLQAKILNSNAIYQIVTGIKVTNNDISDSSSDIITKAEEIGDQIAKGVFSSFVYQSGEVGATTKSVQLPLAGDSVKNSEKQLCSEEMDQAGQCSKGKMVCKTSACMVAVSTVTLDGDGDHGFANEYKFLLSTICGAVIAYFFLVFCLDAAVRAIKLGVLQIVAPIPILSMIDPKGGDGKLKKWGSACGKEYAGLFLRLAGVYFAVSIIKLVLDNNSVPGAMTYYDPDGTMTTNQVGFFVKLFIIIGALSFAKQFPKFIEEILGFKLSGGDGFNLKKRLGGMPGMGIAKMAGAGALGFAGGMAANTLAARQNFGWDKGKGFWKNIGHNTGGLFRSAGSMTAGGLSGFGRGVLSKEKSIWKAGNQARKDSVDARNLRDKRQSLGQGGPKGFVTRRIDDVNRFAGTKTKVDILEDELKGLQYGDNGMQGYQYQLNEARDKAAEFSDFQFAKTQNGVSLDSAWMDRQREWINSYIASTGDTSIDVDRELTNAIQLATGFNTEDAEAYRSTLSAKTTADAAVRSAQEKVNAQQKLIDAQQKKIDDQKKIDAVNKKQK